MTNLRILAVLIRPEGGREIWGAEKSFIEIAKNLDIQGAHVTTIEEPPAIRRYRAVSFGALELEKPHRRFSSLRSIFQTIQACKMTKCDIVYAYTLYFRETAIPALIAASVLRKPLFVSVNDDKRREDDETPLLALFRREFSRSRSPLGTLKFMAYNVARRAACREATACFASTSYVAEFVRSVLRGRRVIVAGRGLASAWTDPSTSFKGATGQLYDACYLGRVDLPKGFDTLLSTWEIVVRFRKNARLLVMGDGDYLPEAKRRVAKMGIGENVVFAGYVADETTIRSNLRSSKVFVFPSLKEGFANAVAQAMGSGLPCVISDIPELRTLYGPYCLVANAESPDSFARSVLELLDDEKKREDYGSRGRSFAESLRWPLVATRMLETMRQGRLGTSSPHQ